MLNSANHRIEQLISDPSFRAWVLGRPEAETTWWENWEKQHADQADLIRTAKAIVLASQLDGPELSENEINRELLKIREGITEHAPAAANKQMAEENAAELRVVKRPLYRRTWFRVAAAVIIAALGVQWLILLKNDHPVNEAPVVAEQLPNSGSYANQSDSVTQIRLPDHSLVLLKNHSTLTFNFGDGKREVVLNGEAFFDVSRDPARPFLVHAGEIVTRVLGTSFSVRARPGENQAEVSVKTGKVYVAKENDASTALILSPNQRVKYDKDRNRLEKGLVDAPEPIRETVAVAEQRNAFHYERTPLKQVFEELQATYGIPIIYDEAIITSCSLSATLGEEPFFEKLRLICKVVNASYEILDGSVVVYAKGCK